MCDRVMPSSWSAQYDDEPAWGDLDHDYCPLCGTINTPGTDSGTPCDACSAYEDALYGAPEAPDEDLAYLTRKGL